MDSMRWPLGFAVVATALTVVTAASAVGPWPSLAPSVAPSDGSVSYAAKAVGSTTTVTATRGRDGHVLRSVRVSGAFGIPAVTVNGAPGGLSVDGRTLVLAQPSSYGASPAVSRFVVLSAATLRTVRTVVLRGDFGFDALSSNASTLFLIQHRSTVDASYAVRAFDLRRGKLLPGSIVDKSETDKVMRGFPVARATSAGGTWVYTLYKRSTGKPFVHALNTSQRYAVCVDLPHAVADDQIWTAALDLARGDTRLVVRLANGENAFTIDTRTLHVVPS